MRDVHEGAVTPEGATSGEKMPRRHSGTPASEPGLPLPTDKMPRSMSDSPMSETPFSPSDEKMPRRM